MLQITAPRFKAAEYERTIYVANVAEGTTIESVTDPGFWAHVAAKLRPFDRIEVREDTGAYWAELLVLSADRLWAKVHVLQCHELDAVQVADNAEYEVMWRGPHHKHSVIRKADRSMVKHGFASKAEAATWMANHAKAMAA